MWCFEMPHVFEINVRKQLFHLGYIDRLSKLKSVQLGCYEVSEILEIDVEFGLV